MLVEFMSAKFKQFFFILKQLDYKDYKKKNQGTNLGSFWNILNPMLYMIILSLYYANIVKHDEIENFPLFVFSGLAVFNYYNTALGISIRALVDNKDLLLRSQYISFELIIIQKVIIAFRELMFFIFPIMLLMYVNHIYITYKTLLLIPILLITTIVIISVGICLAICYVFFADIEYMYNTSMTLLVFLSGTFIPISHFPNDIHGILTYNPIFLSIYLIRNCLVYGLNSYYTAWIKLIMWAVITTIFANFIISISKNRVINKL